ncbi:MAG: helix-turn-helix transcriptional regulator [Rhodospirillales bacterium]|nr:helix-turn-helix transcriptional regulator [Alphaproteobacteria bacterium]MCB9986235.1 helix-turn-helix transcriptional regulator [Rhodospirillales bacterium]USO07210.1 MAG: helix-turn-helix transcriptional regulator [Rhodospirillales bacterium]
MTISTAQIRGARGLLDWSQAELSRRTGISTTSIGNIESGHTQARESTLAVIRAAFERGGIDFIGKEGVRMQTEFLRTYTGTEGFKDFMNHLYETAKAYGGEIVLFNAHPEEWQKWLGQEWFAMHSKRMADLGDKISFRITANSGEQNFISREFAEYRWFPEEFMSRRAMYAYADYIAFVNFEESNVSVIALKQTDFANAFRVLFNIAWDKVALKLDENAPEITTKTKAKAAS